MKFQFISRIRFSKLSAVLLIGMAALLVSCSTAKLPSDVTSAISAITKDLPRFMSQASNAYSPSYNDQATALLNQINNAAATAKSNSKTKKIGEMLSDLATNHVQKYVDNWKVKGKLDANTISGSSKAVEEALAAIRKKAKM